jgi:hypothetical protein
MDDPGGQPFGLAPITLADKPYFDRAFGNLAQPTTDYSFANSFIWSSSLRLYWASIASHLCLFANGTGDLTLLLPPVAEAGTGEASLCECLGRCFAIMDEYNDRHADRSHSRIEYVSDELLERLGTVRGMTLSASPMSGDYVYETARMIDLAGGALKSKRHARSKFVRDHPAWRTAPLADEHLSDCLDLLRLWWRHGDAGHGGEVNDARVGSDVLRHRDALAAELALTHRAALGLRGMGLFVGDRLIGFTLGEAISRAQASIIIEKTHPEFHGSAQLIFSEFCRQYWGEYPECNAGDDWGIPSLRFTKQSYRPTRLLSKYRLTRNAPVIVGGFPAFDPPAAPPRQEVAAPGEAAIAPAPAEGAAGLCPVSSPIKMPSCDAPSPSPSHSSSS